MSQNQLGGFKPPVFGILPENIAPSCYIHSAPSRIFGTSIERPLYSGGQEGVAASGDGEGSGAVDGVLPALEEVQGMLETLNTQIIGSALESEGGANDASKKGQVEEHKTASKTG